jgi:hypothetical protein
MEMSGLVGSFGKITDGKIKNIFGKRVKRF